MAQPLGVKLEIFEGPLDLLLHLIRKTEVDIYDIPVAKITRQYLEYLGVMRELNIEVAGEFLVMAATLSHIKSKMLLPSRGSGEDDEEDPRDDLVAQLQEYMRIKEAAGKLAEREWLDRDTFARSQATAEVEEVNSAREEVIKAGLFDLIAAFHRLMKTRGSEISSFRLPQKRVSLEDRMGQLLGLLKEKDSISFEEFFAGGNTRDYLVVTFLSLLELARVGMIRVFQDRHEEDGWGVLRIFLDPAAFAEEGEPGEQQAEERS